MPSESRPSPDANSNPSEAAQPTDGPDTEDRGGKSAPLGLKSRQDAAHNDTTSSRAALCAGDHDGPPKLSIRRWFILFAVCVLGLSATLAGDVTTVLNLLLELLDLEVDKYIYVTQIYHYLMMAIMVPTAMFSDRFGIRTSVLACVCLLVVDCTLRALLYMTELPGWGHYKMAYYLSCSIVGTFRFAMYILLPLKVAETWFSESERSVAWTIMQSQGDVGLLIASAVYPRIVHSIKDFKYLGFVNMAAVPVAAIACVACVTRSEPATPPSERMAAAAKNKAPFWLTVKRMLGQPDIQMHLIHVAVAISLAMTVCCVLPDIFKSIGFSALFTGNYLTLNALVSVAMVILMARFVHQVENITLACKLASVARSTLFICSCAAMILRAPSYIIVGAAITSTMFRSWSSPHFTNMQAHLACGTVAQETLLGFAVLYADTISSLLQVTFASLIEKHPDGTNNYHTALLFLVVVCVIDELVYLIFFRGRRAPPGERKAGDQSAENEATGANSH